MSGPTQADYFRSSPAEMIAWEQWRRGYSRCPYCTGMPADDWLAMCDCWMAERTADHWQPYQQLIAGYHAWRSRGWTPWPTTSATCGL